jgi:hypothetical protein
MVARHMGTGTGLLIILQIHEIRKITVASRPATSRAVVMMLQCHIFTCLPSLFPSFTATPTLRALMISQKQ